MLPKVRGHLSQYPGQLGARESPGDDRRGVDHSGGNINKRVSMREAHGCCWAHIGRWRSDREVGGKEDLDGNVEFAILHQIQEG